MANSTQSSIEIPDDPQLVMSVIADLERYPEWVDALTEVEVLTTQDDKPDTVRMVLQHKVISDDYTVAYTWQPDRVSWRLVRGRTLKAMDGSYVVEPVAAGSRVTYSLTVDVNLPLPGLLKRTAEKTIIDAALKGLKRQVATVRDDR